MSSGWVSWPPSKRWHLHRRLAVGLAAGILSLGGQTAFAQSGRSQMEAGGTLCIRVYDSARLSPATLAAGVKLAGRILLAAGVPTRWRTASTGRLQGSKPGEDKSALFAPADPESRSCLILFVNRNVSRNAYPGTLGFALPNTQAAPAVTIFYDRIERLERRSISGGASVSQILGYAMAHEIGHVLLGSTTHSLTGIMKGPWGEAEFQSLAKGWLGFTDPQAELMRESAFRRRSQSGDKAR